MFSRRDLLRGAVACASVVAAGCGGTDDGDATDSPTGTGTGPNGDPDTPVAEPEYASELTVAHRADGSLSVTIRAIETVPDSGDDTPAFGDVVYEDTFSEPPTSVDLSEYREDGPVELVLKLDGEDILRETLQPYESLDVTVRSNTDVETDWVLE